MGYLSAWWYNVLFLYTSATVLIAARLSPSILAEVSEESILDRWHKAVEILETYGVFGMSIRQLTTTLCLLYDAVPQQYSRLRRDPRHIDAVTAPIAYTEAPDRRPINQIASQSAPYCGPFRDLTHENNPPHENNQHPFTDSWPDFDDVFDPNDLSWLMTMPLEN